MWVWTPAESTTKNLKMKEVVEEAENRRDAPANGNASEENEELEADKLKMKEEDDVDTNRQKAIEDD
ncbi:hypothetical protein A6R68_14831 [Neotoma lepida]|uniref:Prothymosin alpha n=1 Tax=Neotoma lepida TaxID=56216 RepID=A0A1A6H8K4_NEOLE|nr:hypothetical protein A6R68_14831 [Neotoma lepida]